jgi:hypothetical protein
MVPLLNQETDFDYAIRSPDRAGHAVPLARQSRAPMQFVILLFLDAATEVVAEIRHDCYVAGCEQALDVAAQEDAVRRFVSAAFELAALSVTPSSPAVRRALS